MSGDVVDGGVPASAAPEGHEAASKTFFRRALGQRTDSESQPGRHRVHLRPGLEVGRYVLQRFVDRGGMGEVWEALDTNLQRLVALKFVLPSRMEERTATRFVREARAGARLLHRYIVTTFELGEEGELSWIAQELVPGSWTLADFLEDVRSEGELPPGYFDHVREFVACVAEGLQAAHDAGVIHRDVKPRNVLIAPDDTPKLTDFGLARVVDDSFASHSGELVGTWAYMSPEQVTAKRMGLDHRTDVFSLGVVLYELLALRRPFDGETTHQIAEQIVTLEPPRASTVRADCPAWLADVCRKAIEKAPARRYQSMRELAEALREEHAVTPSLPPIRRAPLVTVVEPIPYRGFDAYPEHLDAGAVGSPEASPDSEYDPSGVLGPDVDVDALAAILPPTSEDSTTTRPDLRTWGDALRRRKEERGRPRRRRLLRGALAFVVAALGALALFALGRAVELW